MQRVGTGDVYRHDDGTISVDVESIVNEPKGSLGNAGRDVWVAPPTLSDAQRRKFDRLSDRYDDKLGDLIEAQEEKQTRRVNRLNEALGQLRDELVQLGGVRAEPGSDRARDLARGVAKPIRLSAEQHEANLARLRGGGGLGWEVDGINLVGAPYKFTVTFTSSGAGTIAKTFGTEIPTRFRYITVETDDTAITAGIASLRAGGTDYIVGDAVSPKDFEAGNNNLPRYDLPISTTEQVSMSFKFSAGSKTARVTFHCDSPAGSCRP